MMRRRPLVRLISGTVATGCILGVAGCADDEETDDFDEETANDYYDEGLAELVETAETLTEWAEGRPGWDQQTIERLRTQIDSARNSFDNAEAVAPPDLIEQIEQTRAVATFHEELLDFYELVIEFEDAESDGDSFADAEQNGRAVEQYEVVKGILEQARDQLDSIENAHAAIDVEEFDAPDTVLEYPGEYTLYVEVEGKGTMDAQERMIDGKLRLNQYFVELDGGFEQLDEGEVVDARDRFEAAETAIVGAAAAFEDVQEHDYAWRNLREESIQLHGITDGLQEAIELFIDATHEFEAGNHEQGDDLIGEGWWVLEQTFE